MRAFPFAILVVALLLAPLSAIAEPNIAGARAFCDDLALVFQQNKSDCAAMGAALNAHVEQGAPFIRANPGLFHGNAEVDAYCEAKMASAGDALMACFEDDSVEKAMNRLVEVMGEAEAQVRGQSKATPVKVPAEATAKEREAMAFCDGFAVVLNQNAGNCDAMGVSLGAFVNEQSAFLATAATVFQGNAMVDDYCDGKMQSAFEALMPCLDNPVVIKAMEGLDAAANNGSASTGAAPPATKVEEAPPLPGDAHPALTDPGLATEKAPKVFTARFETTQGDFEVEVHREWAPNGVDRFYNLVRIGYYDDVAFFRAISGFMLQFGIHGHPTVNTVWRAATIQDDPVVQSNTKGTLTFATSGPDSRTTQLFLNTVDNARLDGMGFAPFGKVTYGEDVLAKIHTGYGEGAPSGMGPAQGRVQSEGNTYLRAEFPKLDWIKRVTIVGK